MEILPDELISEILTYLDMKQMYRISLASKRFFSLVKNNNVFGYELVFPNPSSERPMFNYIFYRKIKK